MKIQRWVAGAIVAGAVVFAMRGCLSKPEPDVRLGKRFSAMCDIARSNVDTPERGVRTLGRYLGKHLDDVMGEFGETITTIERISDDAKHDERARVARDRLREPLRACEADWMKFAEAVEANPEAAALVERTATRVNRTLEIIFSSKTRGQLRLVDMPRELERALDTLP